MMQQHPTKHKKRRRRVHSLWMAYQRTFPPIKTSPLSLRFSRKRRRMLLQRTRKEGIHGTTTFPSHPRRGPAEERCSEKRIEVSDETSPIRIPMQEKQRRRLLHPWEKPSYSSRCGSFESCERISRESERASNSSNRLINAGMVDSELRI